jgi:O-antigen/teichoic acid export membrane protein
MDSIAAAARPLRATDRPIRAPRARLARGVLALSTLSIAASVVNYGSNLAFARALTPASYGDLTSLLALSVVLAVPFAAPQTRLAGRIAARTSAGAEVGGLVRAAVGRLALIALVTTAAYCAAIPLVTDLFHLQAVGPALALAALLLVSFLFPALQGTLQGLERWIAFGLVGLGVALSRLVVGMPWALAGGGAGGAIGGQAIGMSLCLAWLAWLLRGHIRPGRAAGADPGAAASAGERAGASAGERTGARTGLAAGAAFVLYAVIANCDVVLAKMFISPRAAGEYAALATIGKMVVFLPAAVAVIVVPRSTRAGISAAERSRVLRLAALLVGGAALIAIVPAAIAPGFVLRTMFGTRYLGAASGVLPIVCAGGGLAVLYLLVTFTVAIEDARWTWLLVAGVALQVGSIAAFHGSPAQIAIDEGVTVAAVLALNELLFHPLLRRVRRG